MGYEYYRRSFIKQNGYFSKQSQEGNNEGSDDDENGSNGNEDSGNEDNGNNEESREGDKSGGLAVRTRQNASPDPALKKCVDYLTKEDLASNPSQVCKRFMLSRNACAGFLKEQNVDNALEKCNNSSKKQLKERRRQNPNSDKESKETIK